MSNRKLKPTFQRHLDGLRSTLTILMDIKKSVIKDHRMDCQYKFRNDLNRALESTIDAIYILENEESFREKK